nr:MAG TPA: hypothetical protein [Microviridae sp.]
MSRRFLSDLGFPLIALVKLFYSRISGTVTYCGV